MPSKILSFTKLKKALGFEEAMTTANTPDTLDNLELTLLSTEFAEIMPELRTRSEVVYLDFNEIPPYYSPYKNIRLFFEECQRKSINPRLPQQRQAFNDRFLHESGQRYLLGRYLEDRSSMLEDSFIETEEGTIHLGLDIFSRELEPVFVPYDGTVALTGEEQGEWSYGHYLILEHQLQSLTWYSFFGHLARPALNPGRLVHKGEQIAVLGDHQENGGWSRHLHYQLLRESGEFREPKESGKFNKSRWFQEIEAPFGYCRKEEMENYKQRHPDPRLVVGRVY